MFDRNGASIDRKVLTGGPLGLVRLAHARERVLEDLRDLLAVGLAHPARCLSMPCGLEGEALKDMRHARLPDSAAG